MDSFLHKEDFRLEKCPQIVDTKVLTAVHKRQRPRLLSRAKVLVASGVMTLTACVFGRVLYSNHTATALTAEDEQFINEVAQLFAQSITEVQAMES